MLTGALVLAGAALLAGTSGFGAGLVATPLLLLAGFSLPFVVTVNLLMGLVTRVSVAWRLRGRIRRRRVATLVLASVPGFVVGAQTLRVVDPQAIRAAAGCVVVAAVAGIALSRRREVAAGGGGTTVAAGFLGGFLGSTTSLLGVPPALALSRQRLPAVHFLADMALYQACAAALGLATAAVSGTLSHAGLHDFAYWWPLVLAANAVGTTAALRLPERRFRSLTLGVAAVAGVVAVVTVLS